MGGERSLFKNWSLVKNILAAKIARVPYKLNFSVTEVCNSLCRTCNIGRLSRANGFRPHPQQLSFPEIERIFNNFPSLCWLSLSGGEPFLREDLTEIILAAIRLCPQLSIVSLPTNGLTRSRILSLTERLMALKKRPLIYLNFSLDGPPKIHDFIRGVNRNYELTWETYTRLKERVKGVPDFYVGLETTISRYNQKEVDSFFRYLIGHGHRVTATIAHNTSFYLNQEAESISPEAAEVKSAVNFLRRRLSLFNASSFIFRIYLRHALKFLIQPKRMVLPCASLDRSLALYSDGTLSPCFMWSANLGNIRDYGYSLMNAYRSEKAREYRQLIREEKCPICWTPCEATQTIIDHLPRLAIKELLDELWRKT